jgi:hypothetical protein
VMDHFQPIMDRRRLATREAQQRITFFWADVHFLLIAARQLVFTLGGLNRYMSACGGETDQIVGLRNPLEYWADADPERQKMRQGKPDAWRDLREGHGTYVSPTQINIFDERETSRPRRHPHAEAWS